MAPAKPHATANDDDVFATTEKGNAEYAVAKEKCDMFAADAKVTCIKEAKARFGKS